MKVSEILTHKGPGVFTIGWDKQITEALETLVTNRIGVLIVLDDNGTIAGILSERDILSASFKQPGSYLNMKVRDFMTSEVIIVEPDDSVDYVENIMTQNRFRHIPVIKDKVLVGIISIGDIVKAQLVEKQEENKYLKDYITGIQ